MRVFNLLWVILSKADESLDVLLKAVGGLIGGLDENTDERRASC